MYLSVANLKCKNVYLSQANYKHAPLKKLYLFMSDMCVCVCVRETCFMNEFGFTVTE